jgi:hypothetical protein
MVEFVLDMMRLYIGVMRCIVFLTLLMSVTNCWGNLSGPWKGGQLSIDVEGIKDVAITREKLRIDLRPLEQGHKIKITAVYEIEYAQAPRELSLTFISGAESVESVKCLFNGQQVKFSTSQVRSMPAHWQPPEYTPGFVPHEEMLYSRRINDYGHEWINFSIPLKPGQHNIEVSYEVEAGAYYALKHTARFWQTAYILAPARQWKSFGGLDLEVLAPDGWQVRSNLSLANQGEKWVASFEALPADFIALTTVHPTGSEAPLFELLHMLYFFGCLMAFYSIRHGVKQYRRGNSTEVKTCRHDSMCVFLLSFLPLVWNGCYLCFWNSGVPSTQSNYQTTVIYFFLHAVHWSVIIALLMLLSRFVHWICCRLGLWLRRHA